MYKCLHNTKGRLFAMEERKAKGEKMIEKIDAYDWPDTICEADGYDTKTTPDITRRNLEFLADKFNKMADVINNMPRLSGGPEQ